jgi:hypothetical protein
MNDLTPGSSSKNADSVNAWLMVTGVSIRSMELAQKTDSFPSLGSACYSQSR